MPTHRIRLRGFWEVTPVGDGQVRHLRRFGRPRILDPGETAWVVCDAVPGPVRGFLNGEPVGEAIGRFAFDVTARLQPRNELAVEVTGDGPLGEVALEIRSPEPPARPDGASVNSQG